MLNFTVGPVMSGQEVLEIGGQSAPYFRTPEFSAIMFENEKYILRMMNAPENSRCVFLTASGTGSMESCVMNILNDKDKVIVINGGSFGQRFVELCTLHKRNFTEVKCEFARQLRAEQLEGLEDHTALLINMHETSSGLLYDMKMVSDFCKKNDILLIVDAISSFIADELDMSEMGIGAVITGSQKALAVQPGISLVALAPEALKRVEENPEVCMYLSMKSALLDGVRGQTPFTPAVTILLQINRRLKGIEENGGIQEERNRIAAIAEEFREGIKGLPFEIVSENPSNAVTALHPRKNNAKEIFRILKDEYDIWICPNGGEMADKVLRVGHIGNITPEDNKKLIDSLYDMKKRGLL
ncbi:MAG: aminotransferase class V-fold PLP-dependent enzyme [Eubacterium sp.]|nr:aminotransferase class V-fold PLP-dependent enzyme [Eubacterium sp.]